MSLYGAMFVPKVVTVIAAWLLTEDEAEDRTFTRRTNLWFLIAMIITTIYVLNLLLGFTTGAINTLVVIVFGVALVVAGFFIVRRK